MRASPASALSRVSDNIESNITSVATNTSSAAEELTTAHEYQRKAGRRMLWLMFILLVVVGIVLIAVSLISIPAQRCDLTDLASSGLLEPCNFRSYRSVGVPDLERLDCLEEICERL